MNIVELLATKEPDTFIVFVVAGEPERALRRLNVVRRFARWRNHRNDDISMSAACVNKQVHPSLFTIYSMR